MINFNTLKQLGLKSINQLLGQAKEYCIDSLNKSKDYGQSLVSLCNDIEYDPASDLYTFASYNLMDADEAWDAYCDVMLKYNQKEDYTKTLADELYCTMSNEKGEIFQLTKTESGNLVDETNHVIYNAETHLLDPVINNINGQSTNIAQLGREQLDNCQNYDAISRVIEATIDQTDASFNSVLSRMELEYGTVSDDTRYIVDSCRDAFSESGASGVLTFIKNWFSSMSTMNYNSTNKKLEFTNPSAFGIVSNLAGCIGGALKTGLEIVGSVVGMCVPIAGMIINGASKIVGAALGFAASAMDANALATVRWKENGNYEYPISLCQWRIPVSFLQDKTKGYEVLYQHLLNLGSLSINVPGGDMLLWVGESSQYVLCEFHVTPFLKELVMSDLNGTTNPLSGNDLFMKIPDSSTIWDYYAAHCDRDLRVFKAARFSPMELNNELKRRYCVNFSILTLWLLSCCQSGNGDYRLYINYSNVDASSSTAAHSVYYWAITMYQRNWTDISWEGICNPGGWLSFLTGEIDYSGNSDEYMRQNALNTIGSGSSHIRILFRQTEGSTPSGYSDLAALHSRFHDLFWTSTGPLYFMVTHDVMDYSAIIHFGEYYVDTPKVSLSSVIGAIIITAAIAVTAIITFNVAKKKVKKAIVRKRGTLAANVENSWQSFLANPSSDNYDAYYKAVRKNNLWSKFIGGTNYSLDGMWGDAGGSGDAASTAGGVLANLRDFGAKNEVANVELNSKLDQQALTTDQKLNLIISLIRGY